MFVSEKNTFILVTSVLRLGQGLACGGYGVIIYSMVPQFFPDRVEEIFGYMELTGGIAIAISPLIGMFLYEVIGAPFTFIYMSFIYLIMVIIIYKFTDLNKSELQISRSESLASEHIGLIDFLKDRRFLLTFAIFTTNSCGLYLITPILGDRVKELTGSMHSIGITFSMFYVLYALTGILLGRAFKTHKINKRNLFLLSSFIISVAYLLLPFSNSLISLQFLLLLIGFAEGLIAIPFIPEAIEIGLILYPNAYNKVSDSASGFWNIGFALAEFLGPLLGGYLGENYGFGVCTFTYGFICAIVGGLYLVMGKKGKEERLMMGYEGMEEGRVKFNSWDAGVYRCRPVFLKSI